MLEKITLAAVRGRSYDDASRNLRDLAELEVSAKQCQRVAIRIGDERLDEQSQRIQRYERASLPEQRRGQPENAPENDWSGRVAVVQADGGRAQIRDALWGEEKPGDKKHRWWRETHCGTLQTQLAGPAAEDPHPEVPDALMDPLWVIPKFNDIHRQHTSLEQACEATDHEASDSPRRAVAEESQAPEPVSAAAEPAKQERFSGGPPLVKTVVASRQGYDYLGLALAAEAYHRGFNQALSKAFLGDGLKVNWSMWKRHFPHYTPIADLMHALSYVYAAAVAASETIQEGWSLYLTWLGWVWQGQAPLVIEAMQAIAATREESLEPLDRAITYLTNNASRMLYAEYRQAGLPITTSLVESTQKQLNRRVKGTEKFWRDEHLEPLLQLAADDLSDTHSRPDFWRRRRKKYKGFRKRRAKA